MNMNESIPTRSLQIAYPAIVFATALAAAGMSLVRPANSASLPDLPGSGPTCPPIARTLALEIPDACRADPLASRLTNR